MVSSRRLITALHGPITAWVVLVCGLMVTAVAWKLSSDAVDKRARERFLFQATELSRAIDSRIRVYEQVLWGGVGLFRASKDVTRSEWKAYVDALKLQEHWPGIQGMGWSVPILPGEKSKFEREVRSQGFPEFAISPPGHRDYYTSIVYLEPFDWRNRRAFGYDMWSNDVRREAMQLAQSSGEAATSGVITLVQETQKDVQKGFLTYVPVYSGEQGQLRGWVYAAFRAGDLMNGLQQPENEVGFRIYDGAKAIESNLLFQTPSEPTSDEFRHEEVLQLQGRDWLIVSFATSKSKDIVESSLPGLVALLGLVIDSLLFYLITTLVLTQKQAVKLAEQMTKDLRESNFKLNASNSELEKFAHLASHDLQEPLRGITISSQLLEMDNGDALNSNGRLHLENLKSSAHRMRELVRSLQTYTEFYRVEVTQTRIDTEAMVAEVLDELGDEIRRRNVRIEVGDLTPVLADRHLKMVFRHLLMNGLLYRSGEGGFVSITCENCPAEKVSVFCIADDGFGIDPRFQQRAFELFERLHRWDEIPGTGLGLALCRRILKRFGGKIWYQSNEPRGSRFYFRVPAG